MADRQGTLSTANPTSPTATMAREATETVTPLRSFVGAELGDDAFDFELDDIFAAAHVAIIPVSPRNTPASAPGVMVMASQETEEKDDKPKRPLSAYNIFFKFQRQQLIDVLPVRAKGKPRRSHGKIGFADMARTIAFKWKQITPHDKAVFQRLAAADKKRYTGEMKEWKLQNPEVSQKNATSSISKQSLPTRGGADEADAVLAKMAAAPKQEDAPAPSSRSSLTMNGSVMSLSSCLSEAQEQFARAKSALHAAQQLRTNHLQLMQSLGFETRAPESGGGGGGTNSTMERNHRAMLDMAINQSQTLPLCTRDGAEDNTAAYQSFLHDYYKKKQQQQFESMYGTPLPSTTGLALPMAMPQGIFSLCLNNRSVSGADSMQPLNTMASMNQQPIVHHSRSPSTVGGGGGDGNSMAYLANSIGPECCEFLIDIFLQD